MKCTIIILYNFLGFPVHMPTIVSKSLFVVIRLQFSSTKTFFPKIRKSHKITKQHRIKGQKFYLTDVNYVCTKTVPDSTKLWLIKGPKSNFPRGACPRTPPSLAHPLHSDTYWLCTYTHTHTAELQVCYLVGFSKSTV